MTVFFLRCPNCREGRHVSGTEKAVFCVICGTRLILPPASDKKVPRRPKPHGPEQEKVLRELDRQEPAPAVWSHAVAALIFVASVLFAFFQWKSYGAHRVAVIGFCVAAAIASGILLLLPLVEEEAPPTEQGYIPYPAELAKPEGMNFARVYDSLQRKGFTAITAKSLRDLSGKEPKGELTVSGIFIDGKDMNPAYFYAPNAGIEIRYHGKP